VGINTGLVWHGGSLPHFKTVVKFQKIGQNLEKVASRASKFQKMALNLEKYAFGALKFHNSAGFLDKVAL